mmetsp:Transcript_27783/g.82934  ORF Transcript_27783/g.82934 Transcript_27783/m.82934 type:complete len:219 (+) Transcript_27783:671-1327(+)
MLQVEVSLDLLETRVLVQLAVVPLVVHALLQLVHGEEHIAVAGLTRLCSVAGLSVRTVLFLPLHLLLLLGLLDLFQLLQATRFGADALMLQVRLDNLEARILCQPRIPLRVLGQVLLHRVLDVVVAALTCHRGVATGRVELRILMQLLLRRLPVPIAGPRTPPLPSFNRLLVQEHLERLRIVVRVQVHIPVRVLLDVGHGVVHVPRALAPRYGGGAVV